MKLLLNSKPYFIPVFLNLTNSLENIMQYYWFFPHGIEMKVGHRNFGKEHNRQPDVSLG
jgi:hypothetical protein